MSIIEPKELDYLMKLRLLPLPGDDVRDYHGDAMHLQNCNSKSELRMMIRFLTESKPDLIRTAKIKLAQLEGRSTPPPTSPQTPGSTEQYRRVSPISRKEEMRRKEEFLNFSRVLLKYLEHKNKRMHSEAKVVIGDCVSRNKKQEPGYESVTSAMKHRLKDLVGEHYWQRAKAHFFDHVKRKCNSNNRPIQRSREDMKRHTNGNRRPIQTSRIFPREESGGSEVAVA